MLSGSSVSPPLLLKRNCLFPVLVLLAWFILRTKGNGVARPSTFQHSLGHLRPGAQLRDSGAWAFAWPRRCRPQQLPWGLEG